MLFSSVFSARCVSACDGVMGCMSLSVTTQTSSCDGGAGQAVTASMRCSQVGQVDAMSVNIDSDRF